MFVALCLLTFIRTAISDVVNLSITLSQSVGYHSVGYDIEDGFA